MYGFIAQLVEQETENLRVSGSIPLEATNDVSVRTNRTVRYKYHSEKDGIFLFQKVIASQSPQVMMVRHNS